MKDEKIASSFDELWTMLREELGIEAPAGKTPEEPQHTTDADGTTAESTGLVINEIPHKTIPVPLGKAGKRKIQDIRFAARGISEKKKNRVENLVSMFNQQYPGHEEDANNAVEAGKKDQSVIEQAFKIGCRNQQESAIRKLISSLDPTTGNMLDWIIRKEYERGLANARRFIFERKRKRSGQPLTSVAPRPNTASTTLPQSPLQHRHDTMGGPNKVLHPNDIRSLHPASQWVLVVDETGESFDEISSSISNSRVGRFVGILTPSMEAVLPPLRRRWHAVDVIDPVEIDQVVQTVLDAPVGVLGIDVRSLPATSGERWMDGVALLIDWALRLVPVEGKCRMQVCVEQRTIFHRGQSWEIVRRECLRRLALTYPLRAMQIDLRIITIEKTDSSIEGYADAIAFTWAQTNDCSKARLKQSGLLGTCLLDSAAGADARAMLHAWDAFAQGVHLPPALWWDLVVSPDVRNPAAILSAFLHLVGQEAQKEKEPKLWGQLLGEVKSRMAATPVDLRRLAAAVDWLQRYQPDNAVILPALRMVWLTVQLARANHLGEIEHKWQTELESLGNRLFDEAAPLVCHADLHRAVAATNRFDFENAGQALTRWRDVAPAVPGLQYWGQIQSSFGQHAAFLGDNTRAIPLFREAMAAFERLSDPQSKQRDRLQTGAYLAIALMDDPATDAGEVRRAVEFVIGKLPDAAVRLAASDNPNDRYAHHLLLRGLIQRDDPAVAQKYIEQRESWQTREGHPWPLIQLYRGILLRETDPEAAVKLALDGADRAFSAQQGPTVNVIGACCRAVAAAWGTPWPEGEKELARLKSQLPAAADRIDLLTGALQSPEDPLDLLRGVLPFNFR